MPDADALLIRTQPLPGALVATAPRLKVVSRHGVGYDAVDVAALKLPVLTCQFKQETATGITHLAFYAKTARGLMARWAIDHRAKRAVDLKNFDAQGYRFNPGLSAPDSYVFTRPHP